MNVAGRFRDCTGDDEVDEVDDRRLVHTVLIGGIVCEEGTIFGPQEREGLIAVRAAVTRGPLRHRQRRGAGLVIDRRERPVGIADVNGGLDVGLGRDDLFDAKAGLELEVLYHAEEQRVSHGQGQLVLLGLDHHADPIQRHVLGNQHDRRGLGWVFGGIDVRKTELVGEGFGDLLLCGEVQLDQRGAHTFPGTSVLHEGRLQIVLADETRLDKALADLSSHVTVRRGNFSSETRPVVDECVSVRGSNDGLRR